MEREKVILTPHEEIELRKWCVEKVIEGRLCDGTLFEIAQAIYDWVAGDESKNE